MSLTVGAGDMQQGGVASFPAAGVALMQEYRPRGGYSPALQIWPSFPRETTGAGDIQHDGVAFPQRHQPRPRRAAASASAEPQPARSCESAHVCRPREPLLPRRCGNPPASPKHREAGSVRLRSAGLPAAAGSAYNRRVATAPCSRSTPGRVMETLGQTFVGITACCVTCRCSELA